MGDALVNMKTSLRKVFKRVSESTEHVDASSEELTASAEQSSQAVNQVAEAISDVAQGADKQSKAAEITAASVAQISDGIQLAAVNANLDPINQHKLLIGQFRELPDKQFYWHLCCN